MKASWDKDRWIRSAIAAKYLICERDGTIWRRTSASADGKRMSSNVTRVVPRIHKKSGRVYFQLTWLGISKSVLVNRVIAWAFLPNPLNLPQVNHIDGDKEHNWVDDPAVGRKTNLEWSTGSDNEKHAHRTGLKSGRGSQNSNAKFTAAEVLAIRASKATPTELAKQYGRARSTIVNILGRVTWTHL